MWRGLTISSQSYVCALPALSLLCKLLHMHQIMGCNKLSLSYPQIEYISQWQSWKTIIWIVIW